MRISIAVHHFPPRYSGGAELRAYRTATWLRDHGHDVRVICVENIQRDGGSGLAFEDGVYYGLPVRRLSFDLASAPDRFRWTYDNPWIGDHVREYLDTFTPDVLHLISGYLMSGSVLYAAAGSPRGRRTPTVVTLTDFWFLCPRINLLRSDGLLCAPPVEAATCARCLGEERRRYRLLGWLAPGVMRTFWQARRDRVARIEARSAFLQEALRRADALISPSRFLRDIYIQAGCASERIVFSRQGRDFGLQPEMLEKRPAAHLRVGYLGQIAPHKGVHTLVEAVRLLPGATLAVRIYGDQAQFPAYTRRLERMARGDSRLEWAGTYDRERVSHVLRGLDVVVVPSVWYENSPNVILEALAHRTPVIASDLGGMAELVSPGENGLRFAAGDPSGLAARLQELLDDPGLLPRLRAGIGPVKSVAEEMDELQQIYCSAIEAAEMAQHSERSEEVTRPRLDVSVPI